MDMNGVSAIVLAGGFSSRMGSCKAELPWQGSTLIEHQVNKLRSLGIDDIIISGCSREVPGTRFVRDVYPHRGPLAGIHAGLLAARNEHCLVTGIDTPLIPPETLSALVQLHLGSGSRITVLSHGGMTEPIIAVYESSLAAEAERILKTDNTSIRVLMRSAGFSECPFTGDETLLCDCNTPSELEKARMMINR